MKGLHGGQLSSSEVALATHFWACAFERCREKRALSARSWYADEPSWTCDKSHCCVYVFPPPAAGIKGEHQTVARKLLTPQTIRHGDTQDGEDMTSQSASNRKLRKPTFFTLTLCPLSVFTSVSLHRAEAGAWCHANEPPLDRSAPPHLSWPSEQKNCARGPKFRWVQYMRNFQTFTAQSRAYLNLRIQRPPAGPGPRLPGTPPDNYIFILTSRRLVLKAEFRYWIFDIFALFEYISSSVCSFRTLLIHR